MPLAFYSIFLVLFFSHCYRALEKSVTPAYLYFKNKHKENGGGAD